MTYSIDFADSFWDSVEAAPKGNPHKVHVLDTINELRRQPFNNPKLTTHGLKGSPKGRPKVYSADVHGRKSDRRIVFYVFKRTIVPADSGAHPAGSSADS